MNPLEWSAYNLVIAGFATLILTLIVAATILHYAPRLKKRIFKSKPQKNRLP